MTELTDEQILAYHAEQCEPWLFTDDMTDDVRNWYRQKYVTDVRGNPEAVRQLAEWAAGRCDCCDQ